MDGVLTSSQVQPVPPQSSAAPHSTNLSSQHRHTLSEDSTDSSNMMAQPPPTLLRLPPDGHEFPPEYRDSASNSTTATIVYQVGQMNGRYLVESLSDWIRKLRIQIKDQF